MAVDWNASVFLRIALKLAVLEDIPHECGSGQMLMSGSFHHSACLFLDCWRALHGTWLCTLRGKYIQEFFCVTGGQ